MSRLATETAVETVRREIDQLTDDLRKILSSKNISQLNPKLADALKDEDKDSPLRKHYFELARRGLYDKFYTRAIVVVKRLIEERYAEFVECYRLEKKPKMVDVTTYTISDYFDGIVVSQYGKPLFSTELKFIMLLEKQNSILNSARTRLDRAAHDLRLLIEGQVYTDQISAAKILLKGKQLRAAGAVAGVVVEGHLKEACATHNIVLKAKAPTIGDYSDALKAAGVIDTPIWRLVARLADIRNYCVHKKERDPLGPEIVDIIAGAEKLLGELH